MEYFCILTMKFPSGWGFREESVVETVLSEGEETAEGLFWSVYEIFKEKYSPAAYGAVLHWSFTLNELPAPKPKSSPAREVQLAQKRTTRTF